MGWSCAKAASFTMEAISNFCFKQTKSDNVFVSKGNKYFIEWSRTEHRNGAITGSIMKMAMTLCRKSGSIRIEPDGTISRAPKILMDVPVYVLECTNDCTHQSLWPDQFGDPNQDNLMTALQANVDSYKTGGCNAHVSEYLKYIPFPTNAKIVNVKTGETIVSWNAPMFQVWK
jgi:hypothetical protein